MKFAMILSLLLSLLLSACAYPIETRHRILILSYDAPVKELDHAVDVLDQSFVDQSMLEQGVAAHIIDWSQLTLNWRPGLIFREECPGALYPPPYAGCTIGRDMTVMSQRCVGQSSFTHELTHKIIQWLASPEPHLRQGVLVLDGDPDYLHERTEFWQAQENADAALVKECDK